MLENIIEDQDELTIEELLELDDAEQREEKATESAYAPLPW